MAGLAPRDAGGGGPRGPGPVGRHAARRDPRPPPGGQQSVHGPPAVPQAGPRALPVGGGARPPGGGAGAPRGGAPAAGRPRQAPPADRLPPRRAPRARVARPSRGQAVPAGRQDGAADGLAVVRRPERPGRAAAAGTLGVSLAAEGRAHDQDDGRALLERGAGGGGPAGRQGCTTSATPTPPSRSGAGRPSSPSAACSGTAGRRRRSSTRTTRTPWPATRSRPWARP